jgi:hypothetical protein
MIEIAGFCFACFLDKFINCHFASFLSIHGEPRACACLAEQLENVGMYCLECVGVQSIAYDRLVADLIHAAVATLCTRSPARQVLWPDRRYGARAGAFLFAMLP